MDSLIILGITSFVLSIWCIYLNGKINQLQESIINNKNLIRENLMAEANFREKSFNSVHELIRGKVSEEGWEYKNLKLQVEKMALEKDLREKIKNEKN